ncbi:MAG: GNAT family N-acetyltransferase [Pirellulaceae bacterium]|nr:GNAT family N-acetyltransferase [Pirellulaceae bacterium]
MKKNPEIRCLHFVFKTRDEWRSKTELLQAWNSLRKSNDALFSPYFSPRFAEQVLATGAVVEVGIVYRNENVVAILPFERRGAIGVPVGRGLNDAHGPISEPNQEIPWSDLLAKCRIRRYDFHAAPAGILDQFAANNVPTFVADLSAYPAGYVHHLQKSSYTISRQPQKTRRLVRQLGPLRMEFDSRDPALLDAVLAWKSSQYQRTKILDIFSLPSIRRLMHLLLNETDEPRGQLSVLFAGTTPVAGHFGLREKTLLHYWFPAYDIRYSSMSPGTQLFLSIADAAQESGVDTIDFGYGFQSYKETLCDQQATMVAGTIATNSWDRYRYQMSQSVRRSVKRIYFKEQIKTLARAVMPQFDRRDFSR